MSQTPSRETPLLQELADLRDRIAQLEQQIDQLKGQEEATKQEQERLYAVLMNMPVMIDALDSNTNVVVWNRECERVSGYSATEIVGNPKALEWLYPDRAYREAMLRDWVERGDDFRNWPLQMTAKDGTVKTVAWSNISRRVPIVPWKTWAIGVDITEQKAAEEALRESERRLREVFDNMPVGLYHTSPDGHTLMANPAFVHMLGYSSFEDLAMENLEEVSLGSQYPRSEFKRCLEKDGQVIGFESAWKRRDGTMLHAIENARIVRDSHGNELYYEGTVEDITQRAQMEAALRESENRYKTLVESAGESIVVVDEQGVFRFMNTTAAERFGGKPEEYVGKTLRELLPQETAKRAEVDVRTVIRTGRGMSVVVPTTLQGKTRWFNVTIEPLKDSDGQIRSTLIFGRDISESLKAQRELQEYRSHMAHAERLAALGTLSATVAHQMNQPLTVIRLTIQNCLAQLRSDHGMEELVDDLKECLGEVSTASSIVDNFKGFARRTTGRSPGRTNMQKIAERVVRVWEDAARTRRVSLVLDGLDRLDEVCVDERDMEQMFFSLVENAIQAADGQGDHRLSITGAIGEEFIELRFADDCGGIAPEHMDHIFDPFFTTKDSYVGTGLGLCIVEQVLSRVGGRIRVENRPAEGVTFLVTLPRQDA
ncbi:MAG: PAS domain S-box protein [Sedimentisphaerales bacterium]|nr:PAS domain S-box protein [Sedimentisphaerales bacterium]